MMHGSYGFGVCAHCSNWLSGLTSDASPGKALLVKFGVYSIVSKGPARILAGPGVFSSCVLLQSRVCFSILPGWCDPGGIHDLGWRDPGDIRESVAWQAFAV